MSTDGPYTEADVELLAPVLEKARTVVFTDSDGYPSLAFADGEDLARAALDALAAAGRLLPGSARFPLSCECPTRCSSRMSDGIVVLQCQRPVHADDEHRTIRENWRSGDDRELGSTDE
jgi:hypothetical protein